MLINLFINLFNVLKVKTLKCVSVINQNACQDIKLLI